MTPTETDLVPLSTAMREGSRAEHEAAEGSTFMAELLDGRLTAEAYADLLLRLRRVYAALEEVVAEHRDDPIVAAVHDPALERLAPYHATNPGTLEPIDIAYLTLFLASDEARHLNGTVIPADMGWRAA